MAGSGATDGSNEAVGMMALHEALRAVCLDSDWTYSVFWTIRPRIRVRGGNGSKVGDDSGSLMLMWEDGFCRGRVSDCLEEDPIRKAFSKMSIQLYNYGEGLMGKVASDKCHKWVFKEPSESEPTISSYWQSSFDSIPSEWADQFDSGIQTIAVIQAAHGLLQLGSCMIIHEDLQFVLRMRHMFESLAYQSSFFLSKLFASSSSSPTLVPDCPPPNFFNWPIQHPMHSPHFPISTGIEYLQPNSSKIQLEAMTGEEKHESEIKWPSCLSLFDAVAGQDEAARLLFDNLGSKQDQIHHQMMLESDQITRSNTLASKMDTISSSSSPSPSIRHQNPEGLFQDVMETFLK